MAKPTPTSVKDDDDAPAPGLLASVPLSDKQVKGLKVAVTVMSITAVLLILAIIGRVIYLVARPSAAPKAAAVAAGPRPPMENISVALPKGAVIRQTTLSGDRMAVQFDAPGGAGIAVIDLASGQVISRITFPAMKD
jgi:hypothetical protein